MKNVLKGIVPERWMLFLFDRAGIDPAEPEPRWQVEKIRTLTKLLKAFSMNVNGTQPLEKAFVTRRLVL